jgi:hypothetical protein
VPQARRTLSRPDSYCRRDNLRSSEDPRALVAWQQGTVLQRSQTQDQPRSIGRSYPHNKVPNDRMVTGPRIQSRQLRGVETAIRAMRPASCGASNCRSPCRARSRGGVDVRFQ